MKTEHSEDGECPHADAARMLLTLTQVPLIMQMIPKKTTNQSHTRCAVDNSPCARGVCRSDLKRDHWRRMLHRGAPAEICDILTGCRHPTLCSLRWQSAGKMSETLICEALTTTCS